MAKIVTPDFDALFTVERLQFAPITQAMPADPDELSQLRALIRGVYFLQHLRIVAGQRLAASFKVKLGIKPGQKEAEAEKEARDILDRLHTSYRTITEGIVQFPSAKKFKAEGLITNYTELCLVAQYMDMDKLEQQHQRRVKSIIKEFPLWQAFLKHVKGVGPLLGGVILSEIDISKAKYPSSLWAYAGFDVAEDGKGRSRRKEHLREVEYVNKDGETATRNSLTYNPLLKTKLVLLGESFLRSSRDRSEQYAAIYYNCKQRLELHETYKDTSKGHRHRMAVRYSVKMFLIDLYNHWRKLEGLYVYPPHHERSSHHYPQGHTHTEGRTKERMESARIRADGTLPPVDAILDPEPVE